MSTLSSSSSGNATATQNGSSSGGSARSGPVTVTGSPPSHVVATGGRAKSGARGHSSKPRVIKQVTKRGLLVSFNPATYTANVLIQEATNAYLQNVPVACHLDGTSAQVNANCLVFFFDEQNPGDAVITAVYPNGSQGVPSPAPGRVVFVAGFQQVNNAVINAGVTTSFQISGSGGIPLGALGIIYKAYFTSPTTASYINLAPHGGTIGNYQTLGNLPAANAFINANGVVQLDANGKLDIQANVGNCTVNLFTHGYIF